MDEKKEFANKHFEAFGKPFGKDDIKWKVQFNNKEKTKGFAVPYADSRAISDRLDEVVGQAYWQDGYTPWHTVENKTASQLCTISIYFEEIGEWICKTDGAENSNIEPVKGGLSDAFKRAASKWNIGRYLYKFNGIWVEIEARGNSCVIKDSEKPKLDKFYDAEVSRIFGVPIKPDAAPARENKAAGTHGIAKGPVYEIHSVKTSKVKSGTKSTIELKRNDQVITAFLRGEDALLKQGIKLENIQLEKHEHPNGSFYIIEDYNIAA